jgi:hypothetical protein
VAQRKAAQVSVTSRDWRATRVHRCFGRDAGGQATASHTVLVPPPPFPLTTLRPIFFRTDFDCQGRTANPRIVSSSRIPISYYSLQRACNLSFFLPSLTVSASQTRGCSKDPRVHAVCGAILRKLPRLGHSAFACAAASLLRSADPSASPPPLFLA